MKTSIPATPVGAQVENNIYPSPYVGTNAQQIPGWPAAGTNFANATWPTGSPYSAHWWFLNQFTIPSTLAGQRIYVHFDGVNYRANLWVNGTQVANNTGWVCCSQWEQWKSWSAENQTVANQSLDTQMRALRNHPSAFLWMNSSDLVPPASKEQQEVNIEKADNWPNPVVTDANYNSSTVTGLNGMKEGGPYEWEPPIYFYSDTSHGGAFGFIDEGSVGPSVPVMESMTAGLNQNPINWPIDSTWNNHMGGSPFDNLNVVTNALNARYGTATSAADYVKKSQAQNYESWRAQYESYEANRSKTDGTASTGFVDWMLSSGWFSLHLIRARVTDAGQEVLPVFWSDNYISLLPGESRTLTATFEAGGLPTGAVVQVDGFNVTPN